MPPSTARADYCTSRSPAHSGPPRPCTSEVPPSHFKCKAIHSCSKVGASCAGPGEEESARLGGSTSFTVNLNFGQLCLSLSSVTSGKRAGHRPVRKVNPAGFVETKGPACLNPEVFLRFCLGSHGSCWWKEKLLTHWSFLLTEGSSVALDFGMVFTNT